MICADRKTKHGLSGGLFLQLKLRINSHEHNAVFR